MKDKSDTELLDWAEKHPEAVMRAIAVNWDVCGQGGRENFFNFRLCIKDAIAKLANAH